MWTSEMVMSDATFFWRAEQTGEIHKSDGPHQTKKMLWSSTTLSRNPYDILKLYTAAALATGQPQPKQHQNQQNQQGRRRILGGTVAVDVCDGSDWELPIKWQQYGCQNSQCKYHISLQSLLFELKIQQILKRVSICLSNNPESLFD